MMEIEDERRMLELQNLPFVQVPAVLPPITSLDQNMCVVCNVLEKTHAFIPCGHKPICGDCILLLDPKRCPLCNDTFTSYIRIWS